MPQEIGWLFVVLIWCIPFCVGGGLIFILFYKHFRKTKSVSQALLYTVLLFFLILLIPLIRYLLMNKLFSIL